MVIIIGMLLYLFNGIWMRVKRIAASAFLFSFYLEFIGLYERLNQIRRVVDLHALFYELGMKQF